MLTERKKLALTSSTPGKTLLINHFLINSDWYLVDLPGYGYAQRGKREMDKLQNLITHYVLDREQLTCLFVLIDIRHEPSANDKMMYEWIVANGAEPIIIATKSDKIKPSQHGKHIKMIKDTLGMPEDGLVLPFSAQSKAGREEIYAVMDQILEECRPDSEE